MRSLLVVAGFVVVATSAPAQQRDTVTLTPIVAVARSGETATQVPFAIGTAGLFDWRGRPSLGIDEVLSTIPGVFVANRYNPAQDQTIAIRGFGARSAFGVRGLKVLLDGIPQTLPDGQGQLTNVDIAETDRVEVLRGSASSLYGNATGGVVSLWTVPRVGPDQIAPIASGVAGSDGLAKWRVGGAAPLGPASLTLDASRTTSDGYRLHSHADIRRLRAVVQDALSSSTRLSLAVHGVDEPFMQDPGQLTLAEADTGPRSAAPRNLQVDAGKNVTQWEGGATLEHVGDGGSALTATVFAVRRTLTNPTTATLITLGRWAWGTRVAGTIPVGGALAATAGVDAQWQRDDRLNNNLTTSALTLSQLEQVNEVGVFLETRWQLSEAATARAVTRYDRVSFSAADRFLTDGDQTGNRAMSAPSVSVGLNLRVSDAVQPYVTAGTSFETPTTTELTNRPDGLGGFNDSLSPQHAVNIEAGTRGRVGSLVYSASLFWTEVRDELIPFQVPGGNGRQFFQNAGSARHRGAELGASWRPMDDVSLTAAYTFADYHYTTFQTATGTFDGMQLPGIPQHSLYASLRMSDGPLWFAVDETMQSQVFADNANTVSNASWTTTGVRAGWDAWGGRWHLTPFGGVQNLWDTKYIGSVVINAANGRFYEPAPGRTWYVGFKAGG